MPGGFKIVRKLDVVAAAAFAGRLFGCQGTGQRVYLPGLGQAVGQVETARAQTNADQETGNDGLQVTPTARIIAGVGLGAGAVGDETHVPVTVQTRH